METWPSAPNGNAIPIQIIESNSDAKPSQFKLALDRAYTDLLKAHRQEVRAASRYMASKIEKLKQDNASLAMDFSTSVSAFSQERDPSFDGAGGFFNTHKSVKPGSLTTLQPIPDSGVHALQPDPGVAVAQRGSNGSMTSSMQESLYGNYFSKDESTAPPKDVSPPSSPSDSARFKTDHLSQPFQVAQAIKQSKLSPPVLPPNQDPFKPERLLQSHESPTQAKRVQMADIPEDTFQGMWTALESPRRHSPSKLGNNSDHDDSSNISWPFGKGYDDPPVMTEDICLAEAVPLTGASGFALSAGGPSQPMSDMDISSPTNAIAPPAGEETESNDTEVTELTEISHGMCSWSFSDDVFIFERNWFRMVCRSLALADTALHKLRPEWVQPEVLIQRMRDTYGSLDILAAGYKRRKFTVSQIHKGGIAPKRNAWRRNCDFDMACMPYVISPASHKRVAWSLGSMLLTLYDLIWLPMQAFEIERNAWTTFVAWSTQIYWTADIVMSFLTGMYINGELHMRVSTICRCYLRSWFVIDLLITGPLWFVLFLGGDGGATEIGRSVKFARYLRVMRFLRLARLLKFEYSMALVLELINSPSVLLTLGIFKLMFWMVLLNHVVGCIWYWVGRTKHSEEEVGWTYEHDHADTIYKYLTAVHWALTQFQGTTSLKEGTTTEERFFAVAVVLLYLLVFSSFVSSLTNLMMELQSIHSTRNMEQRVVRGYLNNHSISPSLAMRVKKYLEWKQRSERMSEYDNAVATIVPTAMMNDLTEEVRSPLISVHPFFRAVGQRFHRAMRMLCACGLRPLIPVPMELVFDVADSCTSMYFPVLGVFHYSAVLRIKKVRSRHSDNEVVPQSRKHQYVERQLVGRGQHLSEAALWVFWTNKGQLRSTGDASLLLMDTHPFIEEVGNCAPLLASSVLYARRFAAALNKFGKTYHDFISAEAQADMFRDSAIFDDD